MNVARRADGLLSAKDTAALLELLQAHPDGRSEKLIIADLAALLPVSWSRSHNTITLLREHGVLAETDGRLGVKNPIVGPRGWFEPLARLVAEDLASRIAKGSVNCLQSKSAKDGLWLDSMLLPGSAEGLPFWVIDFAVATRDSTRSRFWRITESYEALFLEGARESNRQRVRRTMSAAELDAKLDDDARHGREAEEWVVEFERRRLSGHPLIDQVRRVSDENVAAGYDIVSFSEPSILHHDLFIEVKSYHGSKRFFWSRTEIASAEVLGEDYSLYLVDRGQADQPGYKPQIIRGPYSALLQSQSSGWSVSPTTFECVPDSE